MELSTRSFHLTAWRVRILEAYGLSFGLLAVLLDSFPFGLAGFSSPAGVFLSFLKARILPPGWVLVGLTESTRFELDVITSLALAFLISYPIFAYTGIRLISGGSWRSRTFAALLGSVICLFYAGAVFGLSMTRVVLISSVPNFDTAGLEPAISGYDFYVIVLREVVTWALVFTTPVYVMVLFKFKSGR